MNFAKFLRTTFLQNTSGQLLLILAKRRVTVVGQGKMEATKSVHRNNE